MRLAEVVRTSSVLFFTNQGGEKSLNNELVSSVLVPRSIPSTAMASNKSWVN